MATEVRHRETGAEGLAHGLGVESLNPYDNEGPWQYVDFHDGLTCWVPVLQLEYRTALGWI